MNAVVIFMVWVFPVIVVGTLIYLSVRSRRRSSPGDGEPTES